VAGCDPSGSTTEQAPTHITFGNGSLSFDLPPGFDQTQDSEGTIRVQSVSDPSIAVQVSVHDLRSPEHPEMSAEAFLRFQAQDTGLQLHDEDGKLYFIEHGTDEESPQAVSVTHWQVAAGGFLTLITTEVDCRGEGDKRAADTVELASHIIKTMRAQ